MSYSIPEGSVITDAMVEAYAAFYGTSLEDGSQVPGVVGALEAFEAGNDELPAMLFDARATRDIFAPLREKYFAAHGLNNVPYSNVGKPVEMMTTE